MKDKIWGTGIVLSRDDWYDDTLWHSQGILGEMLCEIRDTYLQNHPETIIQELEYFNRPRLRDEKLHISVQDCVIPTPSSLLHKSNSHPELRSLHGVPLTQVLAQRSAHIQLKSGSPSTGSTPNLQTLPAVPVADPGFSKWGGAVLSQMGGRTSCFQVKSA